MVFHDEFYISSTLPHDVVQPLYSYLVGCGESTKEPLPSGAYRPLKVHTYKEGGSTYRVQESDAPREEQVGEASVSDFGKISPKSVG